MARRHSLGTLLLAGPNDGCTIDAASFEECFGAAIREEDVTKVKRRETADPSKLRELLEAYDPEKDADLLASPEKRPVLQSVPEEDEESSAAGRPSMMWSVDETRHTMEELRRQLQLERDVATDAEQERDDLAKELTALREEQRARVDLIRSLEAQRDAATLRADAADVRATRSADAEAAAKAVAQALHDRVEALNKVKITKDFAAKVKALAAERDALRDQLDATSNKKRDYQARFPADNGDCAQS